MKGGGTDVHCSVGSVELHQAAVRHQCDQECGWDSWSSLGARYRRQRHGRKVIDNSAMKSPSLVLGSPSANQPARALEWPWDRLSAGSEAVSQCKQGHREQPGARREALGKRQKC